MTTPLKAKLRHLGMFVYSLDKMADFYQRWFGLVVTDGGMGPAGQGVFLSADPTEHHQLVFVVGREPGSKPTLNQLSFLVEDFATVKAYYHKARAENVTVAVTKSHGNAISVYILDPEGNQIEIYCHTPWYVSQPVSIPMDFDRPDSEILAQVEKDARADPSFMPREQWVAQMKSRLAQ